MPTATTVWVVRHLFQRSFITFPVFFDFISRKNQKLYLHLFCPIFMFSFSKNIFSRRGKQTTEKLETRAFFLEVAISRILSDFTEGIFSLQNFTGKVRKKYGKKNYDPSHLM